MPDAARRARAVVGGMTLLEAMMRGEVGLMRGEDEPVRRRVASQPQRFEQRLMTRLRLAA